MTIGSSRFTEAGVDTWLTCGAFKIGEAMFEDMFNTLFLLHKLF